MRKSILGKIVAVTLAIAIVIGSVKMPLSVNGAEVTNAGIDVEKIDGISDDFIMGMDVSSYVSVTKSGVVFKDFNGNALDDAGFFNLLKSCGVNYIRVRVWNNPYDANGNGYGGGNCDIEVAATIGKLATNAGMKVLVDFHYSDFWADPAKQFAPKAWSSYTVAQKETAIYDYTKTSLTYLKNQGVNIGMVQIGNETTSKFCGESDWTNMCKLFNAGSKAVREIDSNILVALHFTDPQKNRYNSHASTLKNNNVDYDVFASSFYPEWHGTMSNLTTQLKNVANNYGKKVMIVETSYPYTLEELDGHPNTINKWNHSNPPITGYPKATVQGQADYMASIIKAMADLGDIALGVCYWEGAWNSVGNAYPNGNWSDSTVNNNKILWEKYGSGWATSFAYEYQPDDVGTWYGGTAVDNQSFFDVEGKALASLNVFNYVKTGATTAGGQTSATETTQATGATQTTQGTEKTEAPSVDSTTTPTTVQDEETTKQTEDETTTVDKETETTEDETKKNEKDEETTAETEKSDVTTADKLNTDVDSKDDNKKEETSPVLTVIIVAEVVALIAAVAVLTVIIIKKKRK